MEDCSKACMFKPHYANLDFYPFASGGYFTLIIKKTPLCNVNSLIMDPITKMGAIDAFEQWVKNLSLEFNSRKYLTSWCYISTSTTSTSSVALKVSRFQLFSIKLQQLLLLLTLIYLTEQNVLCGTNHG